MAIAAADPNVLALPEVPTGRKSFARIAAAAPVPNLIQIQRDSFEWFKREALRELFAEISPIQDFTGRTMELELAVPGPDGEPGYAFGEPKLSEDECRLRDQSDAAPLRLRMRLRIKSGEAEGELKEQDIFMGDFPLMTDNGTFIINGAERVVVSQLVRSPGVYFTTEEDPTSGRELCMGKLIPSRGAWLEFETSSRDVMSVKVDRKRKIPVTTLLRALPRVVPDWGAIHKGTDEEVLSLFEGIDEGSDHRFVHSTLDNDPASNAEEALLEFYRRLRPGDPPNADNARSLLNSLFFNFRRYDLGKVGRYKVNKRLGLQTDITVRILTPDDLVEIVREMVRINHGKGTADDIDHLGNRRVRAVGELIQNQFRVGLLRMERVVKERMSIIDPQTATPSTLINIRPVVAAMREFFGGSQLSQFMDQTNPLAELTHKRRLSALGPGGLSRDRAGFEVRDVHHSHYGRICPVETPEGPNIGLIGTMSTFSRVNEMGFLETPYRKVYREVLNAAEWERQGLLLRDVRDLRTGDLIAARGSRVDAATAKRITIALLRGQILREDIIDPETDAVIAEAGKEINRTMAERIAATPLRTIKIRPIVSQEVDYLSADEEEKYVVAQANAPLDQFNRFKEGIIACRFGDGEFVSEPIDRVDYMDVSPKQVVSVSTALIPFLEHDDANRALMGSNMQRQAVPLLRPDAPIVGTGMEYLAARDSGQVIVAKKDGIILSATGDRIIVLEDDGEQHEYRLRKFMRSNQATCINQ